MAYCNSIAHLHIQAFSQQSEAKTKGLGITSELALRSVHTSQQNEA